MAPSVLGGAFFFWRFALTGLSYAQCMKDEPYLDIAQPTAPPPVRIRGTLVINGSIQQVITNSTDPELKRIYLVGSSRIHNAQLGDQVELTAGARTVGGRRWRGHVVGRRSRAGKR